MQPETPASGQNPPPVPPAIAPGSVALTGVLDDCTSKPRALFCTLTVISVQEYGAGTTQFPSGSTVSVSVREAVADRFREQFGLDHEGRELKITIVAERPAPDDPNLPAWRVTELSAR